MIALVISIACLALNAFFVAAEFAIVKVRTTQVDPRARRGEARAVAARDILSKLDRYLSVTQIGITIVSLGLGWVGEPAIERLGERVAVALTGHGLGAIGHVVVDVLGLGTLTFLHVLVGELVPKAIAIRHAEATALATALPLRVANVVFWPILWVMERAQRLVLTLLRIDPALTEAKLSEDEIVGILAASRHASMPAAEEKHRTMERALKFASRPVRRIMVPRVDMSTLSIESSGEEARALLKAGQFSRVPLVGEDADDVLGYLYAKDFWFDDAARSRRNLHGLARPILFVPETADGLDVLSRMRREQVPIAIVVDEYGGTSGLVTIEDLVEEVFGEIRDELDAEPTMIVPLGAQRWEVDAGVSTEVLREAGVPMPLREGDGESDETVGALLLERLARIPRMGDVVELGEGVVAEVVSVRRRRAQRVRLRAVATPA